MREHGVVFRRVTRRRVVTHNDAEDERGEHRTGAMPPDYVLSVYCHTPDDDTPLDADAARRLITSRSRPTISGLRPRYSPTPLTSSPR